MTTTAKAWKDLSYRATLDESALAALEANPAGTIDLGEQDLTEIAGGISVPFASLCATCYTCLTCAWMSSCRSCFTCSGWPC